MSARARIRLHIAAALLLGALAVLASYDQVSWWTAGLAVLALVVNVLGVESARQLAEARAEVAALEELLSQQRPEP